MVKFNIEEESLLITKGRVMVKKFQPFWQEKIAIVKKIMLSLNHSEIIFDWIIESWWKIPQ